MDRKWMVGLMWMALVAAPVAGQGDAGARGEGASGVPGSAWSAGQDDPQSRAEEQRQREEERKERERERIERENDRYEEGQDALDEAQWQKAEQKFAQVIALKGKKADAALYWRAYALNKLGQRAEALTALQELQKAYPQSRYLTDAKALEVEVRQSTGQPVSPESESNCELKLLAINSLMHQDPERAVPVLEKFIKNPSDCPRLRKRALFVLAQSGSPKAREVMGQIARGSLNPDLQTTAVKYLGLFGGKESRQVLSDIYAATNDMDVKKAILHSFMVSGERGRLLAAAKGEASPELRGDAIHWLGVMGAEEELWQLYQAESSVEVKKKILHSLAIGGKVDRLVEIARSDGNVELRKQAIHGLGIAGSKRTGEALVSIYAGEKDKDVRKQVLHALFIQGNVKPMIEIARKETDLELKKQAVHWLSLMDSKEATEFLMEILNQ